MHTPAIVLATQTVFCLLAGTLATAQSGAARYELTFRSTWSAATHPIDFPSNPHFSQLVGGTHDGTTEFWRPAGIASSGIEAMAETGATTGVAQEVRAALQGGGADQVLVGPSMGSPGVRTFTFDVAAAYSRLTLVTMVAPSPDWFVGISGLELMPGGEWLDDLTVALEVYDAGTDSGASYASPNADITPHQPIDLVTQAAGPFQNASRIVGTFHLRRIASSRVIGCGVNPRDSMRCDGAPTLGHSVIMTLDDPTGSMLTPAATFLMVSGAALPASPCGPLVPGLGFGATGSNGELLIGAAFAVVSGSDWSGANVSIALAIPIDQGLVGRAFYLQGALLAPGATRIGLTDGVELLVGL